MATNINTILGWFKTGEKPTQKQFSDSWQSFWHKDEAIPQSSITNLASTLNEKVEKSEFEAHKADETTHATLFGVKEDKTQKGVANGYAPLNSFTKLANQYLDIINDLVTGGSSSLLSAEQGKLLQNQINGINILLTSDNVNLDTIQEIVDAIETVQISLSTILVNDLTTGGTTKALTAEMGKVLQANKVDKETGKGLSTENYSTQEKTLLTAIPASLGLKENKSEKGITNGYAPLNSFTKLASQYLDIINDLVTGGSSSLLSAEQGKQLQNQINNINVLLTSDNVNLDTVQEIVDAIETIQASLSTILVNDLTTGGTTKALTAEMGKTLQTNKVDKETGKSLLSDTEINRLGTLSNYSHPSNHLPSIISQDANNRFVTDAEKATWNAKQSSLGFTAENAANKNLANGYAGLGADGKLIASQLPSIIITDTFVTASQAAMLALSAETGDIAVRTDLNKSFILKGANSTLATDWQELLTPTSAVTTVFSRSGAVTAQTGDYTANQINETATRKFQSANQQLFNDATSSIQTQLDAKVSNATHTGDATGGTALTVKGINGTILSGLATGILKNTTTTGVPVIATVRTDYAEPTTSLATGILKNTTSTGAHTIAVASDFPILNQNTTGTASNSTNLAGQPTTYYAPISSPSLIGIPTAPTAKPGTYSDQLATTSFVTSALNNYIDKGSIQTILGPKTFNNTIRLNDGIFSQFSSTAVFNSNTPANVSFLNSADGASFLDFGSFFLTNRSYRIGIDTDNMFKIGSMSEESKFVYNKANGNLQVSSLTATTLTGGNATDGYISLASTGGLLKNSAIFQRANNIGVGTAAPTTTLHVLGGIRTETTAPRQGITVGNPGEIRAVAGFLFVCSGGTVWTRAALTTF
jgi:hypothetical protein